VDERAERRAFVNITPEVEACVRRSGVQEASCCQRHAHLASVFINDRRIGLTTNRRLARSARPARADLAVPPTTNRRGQRRRAPQRQVLGREVVVAVTNGKLDFGPWEQVFYGEFDGRRKKRHAREVIGE